MNIAHITNEYNKSDKTIICLQILIYGSLAFGVILEPVVIELIILWILSQLKSTIFYYFILKIANETKSP